MPTPFESAQLNLKLFELRREPVLREARLWFLRDFNPLNLEEAAALAGGARNDSFRMVLGYWDMAASLVTRVPSMQNPFSPRMGRSLRPSRSYTPFSRSFVLLPRSQRHANTSKPWA